MILRRYGTSLQSVELNFDSKALTEIGFRRDRRFALPVEELDASYRPVESHALVAKSEGDVQDEVEQVLLADLEAQIRALEERLSDDELLVVESAQGVDYPKTRTDQKNVLVEGENRLYFYIHVDPPLRVSVYRKVD